MKRSTLTIEECISENNRFDRILGSKTIKNVYYSGRKTNSRTLLLRTSKLLLSLTKAKDHVQPLPSFPIRSSHRVRVQSPLLWIGLELHRHITGGKFCSAQSAIIRIPNHNSLFLSLSLLNLHPPFHPSTVTRHQPQWKQLSPVLAILESQTGKQEKARLFMLANRKLVQDNFNDLCKEILIGINYI